MSLQRPVGSDVLNETSNNALVFIAEGIGFAAIKGLIEHAMALDVAEKIFLFWIADREAANYLNNLCRAWNDALDNFEYIPLKAIPGEDLGDEILHRLKPDDAASFDYYLCCGEKTRTGVQRFTEAGDVPQSQILFEAI